MSGLYGEYHALTAADFEDPARAVDQLNAIIARLQDRLDQLEGLRGTSTIRAPIHIQGAGGHVLHGVIEV